MKISEAAKKLVDDLFYIPPTEDFLERGYTLAQQAIDEVKKEIDSELTMANGCLNMVNECLEKLGLDMRATPAMMYPEAIMKVILLKTKEKDEEIENLKSVLKNKDEEIARISEDIKKDRLMFRPTKTHLGHNVYEPWRGNERVFDFYTTEIGELRKHRLFLKNIDGINCLINNERGSIDKEILDKASSFLKCEANQLEKFEESKKGSALPYYAKMAVHREIIRIREMAGAVERATE